MSSTAFFAIAEMHLQWQAIAGILFFHWWTIWFVLGRNFSTTTLMLLVSRGITFGALYLVLVSGVVGHAVAAQPEYSLLENMMASLLMLILFWVSDIALLKLVMRRARNGFSWKRHDMISLGVANCIYVVATLLLVG
jgi:hypothetical protein